MPCLAATVGDASQAGELKGSSRLSLKDMLHRRLLVGTAAVSILAAGGGFATIAATNAFAQTPPTPTPTAPATPGTSGTHRSNENPTHEAAETPAQEQAENNGTSPCANGQAGPHNHQPGSQAPVTPATPGQ